MTTKTKRIRLASVRVPKDVLAPFVDANGWVKDGMTMKLAKARRGWLEAEAARINAEPNREAKVVGTGSYMEISVYATEEVPCTLQYRGVCQVCGGDVAVRDGTIVLHGYERPGYGYVVGNCPGTYNLPANTSIELAQQHQAHDEAAIARITPLVEADAKRWASFNARRDSEPTLVAEYKSWRELRDELWGRQGNITMRKSYIFPALGRPLTEVKV